MISAYRKALLQALDIACLLLALGVTGLTAMPPDLHVFDDYTGASLFTVFFYMLFFYILDAYSVGHEDFRETSSLPPRHPTPLTIGVLIGRPCCCSLAAPCCSALAGVGCTGAMPTS